MLVEVDFNETSVNTISNNFWGEIVNSRPLGPTSRLAEDYNTIVKLSKESLFGQIPDYLKDQKKLLEEDLSLQQKKEEDAFLVKKFVAEMISLQKESQKEDCMYRIYEQMSSWSMNHKIECCDYLLDNIEVNLFDIHILLSLLMATFPMRKRLNYRQAFFTRVQNHARQRYSEEMMNELFVGLE